MGSIPLGYEEAGELVSAAEEDFAWQLRCYGIAHEREYRFCDRRWRFDFAMPERKVAVEIEGGVFVQGRHTRGAGAIKDMEKYNRAALDGWRVLRFPPDKVKSGQAIDMVREVMAHE
jgi:very-short-patch-repair endonuclease